MKNLVRNNKQPVGLEMGVSDMDGKAKSGSLGSYAHEMPMKNNAKRNPAHLGAKPGKGNGAF